MWARVIDHGIWDVEVRSDGTICQLNNKGELFPDASGRSGRSQNTMLEHAKLIAEAFNTQSECGLSPRELLDKNQDYKAQNARLTVALRNLCKHFPTDADMAELGWEVEYVETACQAYDTARAVLATQKE